MKIEDIRKLPEGTQLRTTGGDIVTLTGTVRASAIARGEDGQTREYRSASLHLIPDPHPIVTGRRPALMGHTVTVERADRPAARLRIETERDWQSLIGRLAVVERRDGRLREVCAIAGADFEFDDEAELVAGRVAGERGARYVPAGS